MKHSVVFEKYKLFTPEPLVSEELPIVKPQTLPAAPFPRKYVHSVFANKYDAWQAALALRAAGFDERDIYILNGSDFIEAVSEGQSAFDFLTSMDYDVYLRKAQQGSFFLAVHPTGYSQLEKIRALLAPHHARLVKYIDTWTVADLLP